MSHLYDEKLLDLRDVRVHYYYSLLERYMKHVFVAGLVMGFLFFFELCSLNFAELMSFLCSRFGKVSLYRKFNLVY